VNCVLRGFGRTCFNHLQGGKVRSVKLMSWKWEQHALVEVDTYPSNYTASQPTWQRTLRYIHMICVRRAAATGEVLYSRYAVASCSALQPQHWCSETQNSLHEKPLCLAPHSGRARPYRALLVSVREKMFSDTVLPKERDERLATVVRLNFYSLVVTICTTSLTLKRSTFCPHSCIYVFCVDLRTNSDYFPIQH
jgi:hypothetical protein